MGTVGAPRPGHRGAACRSTPARPGPASSGSPRTRESRSPPRGRRCRRACTGDLREDRPVPTTGVRPRSAHDHHQFPQAPQSPGHRRHRCHRRPQHAAGGRHARRRLRQAPDRHRLVLERDHPVQPVAATARDRGEGGRAHRGWLPAGVRHHLGLRRHLHGAPGHALLTGEPGDHRRLGGDRRRGRAARRDGAAGGLRQVAARDADGRGPARPRRGVRLRRIDHAGPGRRPRGQHR